MSRFRPGVLPSVVVALLLPLLVTLGFWQLARAEEKRALLAHHEASQQAAPISLAELEQRQDVAGVRIRLHGQFDAGHSLLLDNRTRDGRPGVELLQPFYDQPSGLWLLVNRGWLPWPDRRTPPQFTTPEQTLELQAQVYLPPGNAFQLQADPPGQSWPRLITRVEPEALWQQLGRGGMAHEVRLEPGPASYQVQWPVVAMTPQTHIGYAVQWFALAAALCCLYLYFGLRNAREPEHEHDPESSQPLL
ncbi:cytochrome oxidase biogenesis protein Surf1,facilitates heme A insertion [Pseudomonas alcaligenes]|uniref:SURF1-like protein n=1 Tax=Aquipseudomonas alcaligenes TaxID=43263 RepID=A0ABR7S8I8_AQUAC|nr:SURF1 family protein [Pseudomonas alcaligenes]MBC9252931.1 cytochrome oxidase biogenesis protein Surf1,facilitates heme A insertion [Pseudomonas alcaligenes]